jgi:signal transduction histidine kinase/PAS domain-containing protein
MMTELGSEDGHMDALVRLEEWQTLLLTCVPAFVWSTDRELRITASAGSRPCGLGPTLDDLVRAPLGESLRAGDRSSVPVAMHLRAMDGEPVVFDQQWAHRFFRCRVAAVRDARQVILGCVGVAIDRTSIEDERMTMARTEQRLARQRLRSATSLLEATLESTADGLLVVDLRGNIVKSNARFAAIWHLPRSLIVSGNDERAVEFAQDQTSDPAAFRESTRKVYEDPERVSHDELLLKDGRVLERYSLPQRVDGVPIGRVWSFRDVTLRRRAEAARDRLLHAERGAREAAQRAAARASLLAEASRLLASLDHESALASLASLVTASFADWCALDMIQPDGSTRRIARSGSLSGCAMLPCCPAERDVAVREEADQAVLGVPLAITGELIGSMRFGRQRSRGFDPADLALAEDLAGRAALTCAMARSYRRTEEALRARDEFLSVASHEIRAPLASLQTATDGLLAGAYTGGPIARGSPLDRPLRLIGRQVRRLARLAEDLVDAVTISSTGITLERADADLSAIVAGAVERTKAELGARAAEITLEVADPLPGSWDRRRLAQVTMALLSNAVRYGAGKPIAVRVEQRDEQARFSVRDGGIGIAPDRLPTLFQRFDRAGISHDYGGLGLGLYIAHAIVAAHGGTIAVESAPDRGSTFVVTLPPGGHGGTA